MLRSITVVITVGFFLLISYPPCTASQDVIDHVGKGTINWTKGALQATGVQGPLIENFGKPVNCQKALTTAKTNAHHNLLEVVKAVRIDGATSVDDFAGNDDIVMAKLMGMVKNTPIVNQEFLTDGTVAVTIELTIFGGFSQLVLPREIEHVESIKPIGNNHANVSQSRKPEPLSSNPQKEIYTGLVVDARGLDVKAAMTPKILDENWQEIYGPAFVSREIAVQKGMCRYESDLLTAQNHLSVLDNPLTVKGLKTRDPHGSDIIISNTDALKIKSASEHLMFLKQCQVIIVVDQKDGRSNNP